MKKLISFVLISVMTLSLAACGAAKKAETVTTTSVTESKETEVSGNTEPSAEDAMDFSTASGKLKVWLNNDDWIAAVEPAFNAIYPNVELSFENIGGVDQRPKVSLDGPAGNGPDVFIIPHDNMAMAIADGLTMPFPEDLKEKYSELLNGPALGTAEDNGVLYGVPITVENMALFYNKDLWGAEPPKTFEEIFEFAKTYNDFAASKYAFALEPKSSYGNYMYLTAFGFELFGPNHDNYKTPNWDTEPVTKGVNFHNSLKEIFPLSVQDATYDEVTGRFQKGEIPLIVTGPWAIADAKKNGVNFGVAKIPTIEGKQPRPFSGSIIANVSSYTENEVAAFAFVDFLATEAGAKVLYDTTGKLTALKDVDKVEGLKDDPYLKGIIEQSEFADPMPSIPEVQFMWTSQEELFSFTWSGQLTTEEAQSKAMETYRLSLETAGKSLDK